MYDEQLKQRVLMPHANSKDPDIFYSFLNTVAIDSVSGQRRAWSDYANAQSDQGLRWPHLS